ncbi:MAG: APC family permease [Phycisphaerae bacterium]
MTGAGQSPGLGQVTLVCLVVANMIGAGIFTTTGYSLAGLQSPAWVMLAWCIGGVIAIAGAISYGALVMTFRESGGEYLFLARRFHPLAGFLAGWVSMLAGFTGAIAFAALAFESYIAANMTQVPSGSLAVAAILFSAATHAIRRKPGTLSMNILVFGKLTLLLILILCGYVAWTGNHDVTPVLTPETPSIAAPSVSAPSVTEPTIAAPTIAALATTVMWISLSFSGFNAAVYVAEESSVRSVKRAMMAGCTLVVLLYLAANALFLFAVPGDTIRGHEDVAARTAAHLGGATWEWCVRITISIALLTSVSSMMLAGPRVYHKMAVDGLLPRWFAFGSEVPTGAILFQAAFAIVIVYLADLKALLDQLSFMLSLCSAFAVTGILIPGKQLEQGRITVTAKLAGATYVAATFVIAGLSASHQPRALIIASIALAVGLLFFVMMIKTNPASSHTAPHGDEQRR